MLKGNSPNLQFVNLKPKGIADLTASTASGVVPHSLL